MHKLAGVTGSAAKQTWYAAAAALEDDFRVRYYQEYLAEAIKAVEQDGVKLKGYFAWSLLDNFGQPFCQLYSAFACACSASSLHICTALLISQPV